MSLDKSTLKATIISIATDMLGKKENSIPEYAERLSNAIDAFVRSGTVTTQVTTQVTTTGTAIAQTGLGEGTGTGSIT